MTKRRLHLVPLLFLGALTVGCLDATAPEKPGEDDSDEDSTKDPDDRAAVPPAGLYFA